MAIKLKLKLSGMHCKSCSIFIKDILKDENVDVISIDEKTGNLEILYDEKNVDIEKIKSTLAKYSYPIIN